MSNLTIKENISLQSFNTFGVDVEAEYFARFQTEEQLMALLSSPEILLHVNYRVFASRADRAWPLFVGFLPVSPNEDRR